jgi:AcrR family transcriptional regulator
MPTPPATARRRGRPPKDPDAVSTAQRLIDAAFAACVAEGFDAVSLADVAAGAGVTANAVYKHFDSKSALLVATAKHALELLPVDDDPALDPPERARAITRAFLVPEARSARRFVAELAAAAPRHPDLAQLMAQWNDERLAGWPKLASTGAGRAKVKAFYVLLLGACQLEALDGIDAPLSTLSGRLEEAAAGLFA